MYRLFVVVFFWMLFPGNIITAALRHAEFPQLHTLYPGCNIIFYSADKMLAHTSREKMDCRKLTLFLL